MIDIAIIMGSRSDYKTMKNASDILEDLNISFEMRVISAHRTPDRLYKFAKGAAANGIKVIIAGAGGAAHLPGMVAAMTHLPVLGVPVKSNALSGMDSLLSIVQMPKGVPVGTFAIGMAGAANAAIFGASIIALNNEIIQKNLVAWRKKQTANVSETVF